MSSLIETNEFLPGHGFILCCLCGKQIQPNSTAMCSICLQSQFKEEILSTIASPEITYEVVQCGKCEKWHANNSLWVPHDLESNGLMILCLKKLPGLHQSSNQVKIIESNWIWTEPHSKQLKINVKISKSLVNEKVTINQNIIYNFVIKHKQCLDCIHQATDHTFGAMIQIRQYTSNTGNSVTNVNNVESSSLPHKHSISKIFFYIEQLLIKLKLFHFIMNLELFEKYGIDIYCKYKNQVEKILTALSNYLPIKLKTSKKLVSTNKQNNSTRYEYYYFVEIIPLNKHDLVLIPKQYTGRYELMLVHKFSSNLHLINPTTLNYLELNANKYFQLPCQSVLLEKHLIPFVILDIIPLSNIQSSKMTSSNVSVVSYVNNSTSSQTKKKKHNRKNKTTPVDQNIEDEEKAPHIPSIPNVVSPMTCQLAEAVIMRESDLGDNDESYTVITHLGHLLQPGDTCLGYDLVHGVFPEDLERNLNAMKTALPDVILVRKIYPEKEKKMRTKKKKNRMPPWMKEASKEPEDEDIAEPSEVPVKQKKPEKKPINEPVSISTESASGNVKSKIEEEQVDEEEEVWEDEEDYDDDDDDDYNHEGDDYYMDSDMEEELNGLEEVVVDDLEDIQEEDDEDNEEGDDEEDEDGDENIRV